MYNKQPLRNALVWTKHQIYIGILYVYEIFLIIMSKLLNWIYTEWIDVNYMEFIVYMGVVVLVMAKQNYTSNH